MKRILTTLGRILKYLISIGIILSLIAVIVVGIYLYRTYSGPILELKRKAEAIAAGSTKADFQSGLTSIIYDANGEKITTLRSGRDAYYLVYEEIPRTAIDIMLVTEDRKFYSHGGVDYIANVRAAITLLQHKGKITQGGSTITQQLARTVYLTYDVTYERKIEEIFLAWELEKLYTKNEILEYYMNNIYFANGYYGIQAAANGYFGKSIKELTLSQTAFLCSIPNSPNVYDPYLGFDLTMERRDRLLVQMRDANKITQAEYEAAIAEDIVLSKKSIVRHNYVETYAKYCAVRALMKQDGFVFQTNFETNDKKLAYQEKYEASYDYWQQQMYSGGYRIYTSIDLEKQEQLQRAVNEGTSDFTDVNEEGFYEFQASAVCIDNSTGYVVAIVGGREQEYGGYTLNRAYQSFRQPGSSIKPLIIYTPMFERGLSPDDIVVDEKFQGGPVNSGGSYAGEVTIRYAVERSKNTIAWKLLTELTPEVGLSYLENMSFRRIVSSDYVPAAALGGFTYGASALEMTSAYAAIANDGVFRTPTCIVRITDGDGTDLLTDSIDELRVYETNAARVMTNVLKGVLTVGTAKKSNLNTAIAAGKTGTTNDKKDGWFIGYTAYYTTGVWTGNDMPKSIETLSGSTYPASIWKTFMDELHEGLEVKDFAPYIPIEKTRFSEEELAQMQQEAPTLTPGADSAGSNPLGSGTGEGETTGGEVIEDGNRYQVTPTPVISPAVEEYDPTEDPA